MNIPPFRCQSDLPVRSFEEALAATLLVRRSECAELEGLVSSLGARADSPEGRRVVRAHIRDCSTCQKARGRYLTAAEILASLAPVPLTPGVQDAIWASLATLLGLGSAAAGGIASAAHGGGSAHAAHPSLLDHARAHPLATAAGGVALAAVVGAGIWAGSRAIHQSSPASSARDPSRVWSPSHDVGKRSTENRIRIAWSRQPGAVSYSVTWNHAPRGEPDAVADLRGSSTGITSPTLAPGRWYFHLRTKGRDGTWTHTVHLGPFVVAAPLAPPPSPPGVAPETRSGAQSTTSQGPSATSGPGPVPAGGTSEPPGGTSPPAQSGPSAPPARDTTPPSAPPARDTTPPSGQKVQLASDRYHRTLAVPLVLTRGSDGGSGVDPATGVVQRSSAALADGSCDAWGSWSRVALRDSADRTVADGRCYRYRYRISDRAGNRSAYSKPSRIAAVDATPPAAPTLSLSERASDTIVAGTTIVYRPAGPGGTFVAAAASDDAGSGLGAIEFPGLGGGMTPTAGTRRTAPPYEVAYTWASGAVEAGAKVVTARDRAGNTASARFTVTADRTGPEGLSATVSGGPWFPGAVPVAVGPGTDAVSGVDSGSLRVERDSALLSTSGCGPFGGAWKAISLHGGADTSVESGSCYRYRVSVADKVGNRSVSPPSGEARIDTTPPLAPGLTLSESSPSLHVSTGTLFYRPAAAGAFTVAATSGDPESGIARVSFPTLAGAGGGGVDETAPYEATYDWAGGLAATGAQQVNASNGAGLTAGGSFTLAADALGPTGMSVTLLGGDTFPGRAVPMRVEEGSDADSGLDAGSVRVERDSAALAAGVCGLYSGTWTTVSLHGSADTSVEPGNCYRYRVSVSDNVGNVSTSPPSRDAKVG
jgi:hypothetical protein